MEPRDLDWKSPEIRLKQAERRLYELTREVKGMQPAQADRLADVVEQIQEVRQELQRVSEKQDKMAEWIKKHMPRNSNESK